MSKEISHDQPLSDEDRAYLKERGRHWEIELIDRLHPPKGTPEPPGPDELPPSASLPAGTVLNQQAQEGGQPADGQDGGDPNVSGPAGDGVVTIDDDIDVYVEGLPNADAVKAEIKKVTGQDAESEKRADLNDELAVALQDKRNAGEDLKLEG